MRADKAERGAPVSDNWADDVLNAYSLIQLVGSRDDAKRVDGRQD